MQRPMADIHGIHYQKINMEQAIADALSLAEEKTGAYVVTPNPEILQNALHEPALYDILQNADLVLPDGIGVLWAARILGDPIPFKVAGVELGEGLLREAGAHGLTVAFLGAKPGIAEKAAVNMCKKYPDLIVRACFDGYFTDGGAVAEQIRRTGADILFVCLGSPKQEYFIRDYGKATGARLLLGLGGSLDIYAGTVLRAPRWMIRMGMEWLYRLIKEPRRFGRMLAIPRFLFYTIWVRLKRTTHKKQPQ